MKSTVKGLYNRYRVSLRGHLQRGSRPSRMAATRLGREAVALGLETLELARIHELALAAQPHAGKGRGQAQRADRFFADALIPIVETHRGTRQSKANLDRLAESLNRRTLELASANRQLLLGVKRRKTVEAALRQSGRHYTRLLRESVQLQEGLRQLTHQVLSAQEEERRSISIELQDEIAQTLLGINVRLLTLKQQARKNSKGLKNEIASTQRLVVKSTRSVRRFAREFTKA